MFDTVTEDEVLKLAEKVGRKVHRDYPSVERTEIVAEALIHIAESDLKSPSAGKVFSVMERSAYKFAAEERYRMMLETSQYIYLPVEVRSLLRTLWGQGIRDVPTSRDDFLYAAVEQRTVSISLMDLKSALVRLKPNHLKTLERKFRDDQKVHSQEIYRAVEALTKAINREVVDQTKNHDGPGARKSVSNDKAQHFVRLDNETTDERDALTRAQAIYKHSPSKPAGTFHNWNRYKEGNV